MSKVLEAVARARDARGESEARFSEAMLRAFAAGHSWREIGDVARVSKYTARYHALDLNERRRKREKGKA